MTDRETPGVATDTALTPTERGYGLLLSEALALRRPRTPAGCTPPMSCAMLMAMRNNRRLRDPA